MRINPVRTCLEQFRLTIAATEQTDSQGFCPTGGHQIPNTIADHNAITRSYPESSSCHEKKIRVRLRALVFIASDNWGCGRNAKWLNHLIDGFFIAACGDRPLYS